MMRPLVIDDAVCRRVKAQVEWADRPENRYYPERDGEPPGDNPAFVTLLEVGYRVVYSRTAHRGRVFRHLSVSIESGDRKYPNPTAALTIATLFGFTGGKTAEATTVEPGNDWILDMDGTTRSVVIAQPVE